MEKQIVWEEKANRNKSDFYSKSVSRCAESWIIPVQNDTNWYLNMIDSEESEFVNDYVISAKNHGYKARYLSNHLGLPMHTFVLSTKQVLSIQHEIDDNNFVQAIIDDVYNGKKEEGVEKVYNYFGKLLRTEDYTRCNLILGQINRRGFEIWILLPFLTLSKFYKQELPNRSDLFGSAVIQIIESMTLEQAKATINRLK